ncbi:MAG TPA: serine/threonine-protein kinase [Polyangia bacterium]|nr:serine/threonine-protein kinase [Polyangia bacterium]
MQIDEQALDPAEHHLDKYRPIARIGRGGMAEVLLAVLTGPAQVRKLLVLKRPLSILSRDTDFSMRFLAEARIASRLNHPNVISTFEVGLSSDGPFIVMEYLDGQPLSKIFGRLGALQMPLSYRLHVLRNLLAGLDYVHTLTDFDGRGLRLVHRDVSPQNVFICYDGRVKLVDFGIAKAEGLGRNSRPGIIEGKIAYMAPEQLSGRPANHRADLFSFGVILWETLTGQRITMGASEDEIVRQRTRGEIPDVRQFAPETPQSLIDLCQRALTLLPEDRIPSAAAIIEALDMFIDRMGARINDREVGQYIGNAFSAERDARRRLIESQMAIVEEGLPPSIHLPDLSRAVSPSGPSEPLSMSIGISLADEAARAITFPTEFTGATMQLAVNGSLTSPTVIPSGEPVLRRRTRPPVWALGAAAMAAVAVLAGLAVSGSGTHKTVATRPAGAATVATRPATTATTALAARVTPPPAARPAVPSRTPASPSPIIVSMPPRGMPAVAPPSSSAPASLTSSPEIPARTEFARPTPLAWRAVPAHETSPSRRTYLEGRPGRKPIGRGPSPGESLGRTSPAPRATIDADNPYTH